ncbi:hypothetical protein G5V59_26990 [Nocardioides sp. W3-2-3]|uniref:hypothetical protein n=1 Tax=Nocardioides convexus TaxID=2712224 RepID=UPI0024184A23|nr:hypothetical protein [Nocardioides convexus]NHA02039.1 hypothetical protein [Nocardioides convexus]
MGDEITPGIDEQPGEQSAAAVTSHLTSLRDRRAKVREELTVDFAVPRYDPPIYVRYRPLTQGQITVANKRAEKSKDPSTAVTANAVLRRTPASASSRSSAAASSSVDIEDLDGDWPRFDDRLGQLARRARQQRLGRRQGAVPHRRRHPRHRRQGSPSGPATPPRTSSGSTRETEGRPGRRDGRGRSKPRSRPAPLPGARLGRRRDLRRRARESDQDPGRPRQVVRRRDLDQDGRPHRALHHQVARARAEGLTDIPRG